MDTVQTRDETSKQESYQLRDYQAEPEVKALEKLKFKVQDLLQLKNGKLVTCSVDILMWDLKTGEIVKKCDQYTLQPFICLRELSNGFFAVGGEGALCKFSSDSGSNMLFGFDTRLLERVNSFVELPGQVAFVHNNDILIWGYRKNREECEGTLKGHTGTIWCLINLSNGNIASGAQDKTIKIWNHSTQECIKTLEGHTNLISCLIQLPNGNIASGSHDKTVKIWDSETGECLRTMEHTGNVLALTYLPDGNLATSGQDRTIKMWNPSTGECVRTIQSPTAITKLISLNDGNLAGASWDWNTNYYCVKIFNFPEKSI